MSKKCLQEQYAFFLHRPIWYALGYLEGSGWSWKETKKDTYECAKENFLYRLVITAYRYDGNTVVKSITVA